MTEVTTVRHAEQRPALVTVMARFSVTTTCARLHIDLQRVTTALCPASPHADVQRAAALHAAA
ncbi:hypothetical protein [Streptacidiphilus pinicola]|uniref:hypothetical protein n=1 Tax=Streptacidiphilus pinicola TaxID=2219663 RepID=UPI000DAD558D|nr:hypothetical protein [Streptacidiphilus pinicola]